MNFKDALPWLVPLIVTLLAVGFQMYGMIDRVDKLEETGRTRGDAAIAQLQNVDNRVSRLEELCCGEVVQFKDYIKEH
jgi:hypothetical protein